MALRDAIDAYPGYLDAYRELGIVLQAMRAFDEAAEALATYLRLAPKAKDASKIKRRLKTIASSAGRRAKGSKRR